MLPEARRPTPTPRLFDVTTVVAALIERRGRILICRRRDDQIHGGKWEFPGGKIEAAETPGRALSRELHEELGIEAEAGREITRYRYQYPERNTIELIFFRVEDVDQQIDGAQFAEVRWEPPENLPSFDFLAGDVDFVNALARGEYEWRGTGERAGF